MRTLVFPGLLHSARHNLAMGVPGIGLFEVGHVFLPGAEKLPEQPARLAGVLAGEGAGFFEAKGVVEALLAAARVEAEFRPAAEPFLHPGRSAAVADGFVGELHPGVAETFGLEGTVAVFELGVEGLRGPPREEIPSRPTTACWKRSQTASDRGQAHHRTPPCGDAPRLVCSRRDRGPSVPEGEWSVALHLVFQSSDRLTDAGDASRARIVAALGSELGGELRE